MIQVPLLLVLLLVVGGYGLLVFYGHRMLIAGLDAGQGNTVRANFFGAITLMGVLLLMLVLQILGAKLPEKAIVEIFVYAFVILLTGYNLKKGVQRAVEANAKKPLAKK